MPTAARLATAPALVLALAFALDAQPPDAAKKPADPPKVAPAPKEPPKPAAGVKLADGTYLWTGDALPDTVTLTPQELQKLLDQVEQLKKQLAARKATAPSGCAVRGKVEKRGETLVAALKLTYSFRTTAPRTAVALGGKRGFLVAASLDGGKLPVLDTGDDGFVVLIDAAGDHTLSLDLDTPVGGRGGKTEVGFELGLPRAAITTLALELPPDVKQVGLATRTPDPTKAPETRRVPALDVKRIAPKSAAEPAYALGPVDQLELTWEPPAAAAQPAEAVRSAEFDITTVLNDGAVETTARVKLKGPSREWKFVAPANADVTVERAVGMTEAGPTQTPSVAKPGDPNKPVWKIELPGGSVAADWVVVAAVRTLRPKAGDAKHRGPFAVGPFAVPDVFRQSGTVRVTTAPNSRFVFKHGPELRQAEVAAPPDDDRTAAQFKLATGPTSGSPSFAPLLTVESHPLQSAVRVKPTYRLRLTDAGWRVRAEVRVTPIRRDVEVVTVEVPAEWGTPEATPAELVDGVKQVKGDGPRRTVEVRLTGGQKLPFDLVLDATVPFPAGVREFAVPLLRFPGAEERDAALTAVVPDGLEVRGTGREWAGEQPLGWGQPLAAVAGPDGKLPKAVTTIGGKFEHGLARADLAWQPYRPDLVADVRADVTVHDRQIVVVQQFKLKAADGFARPVRLRAPAGATGLKSVPPLDPVAPGEWQLPTPADAKDVVATVTFAVPLPAGESRKAAVGLVWPPGATRVETRVRVWSNALVGRTITADAGPWREVPSEPTVERDALPAVTLTGTGPDLPLVLDVRDGADPAAVAVWVERAAVQASATEDGGTAVRARFLFKRWLAGAVEVRLPPTAAGTTPEFQIDGKRLDPAATDERAYRVALPEARPGRTAVLDVRYQLAADRAGGESLYAPPSIAAAAFAGPVRWLVTLPPGDVALSADGARVEQRWRWRAGLFRPSSGATPEDLDRWLRTGSEPGEADGDAVVARQSGLEPLRVRRAGRIGFAVACSLAAFVLGWLATRARGSAGGLAVAVVGAGVAAGAVAAPLAAAQVAAAVQPGVAALALVLLVQAAARWYHRSRVTYLPGFTRRPVDVEPSATGSGRHPPRGAESTGSLVPVEPPA